MPEPFRWVVCSEIGSVPCLCSTGLDLASGTPLPGMTNLALIITWLNTHMSSQSAVGIVLLVYLSNETLQSAVRIVSDPGPNGHFQIVVFSFNILRTPLVHLTSISSGNYLVPNRRQAIIWTNYGHASLLTQIWTSLGHSELNGTCVLVTFLRTRGPFH